MCCQRTSCAAFGGETFSYPLFAWQLIKTCEQLNAGGWQGLQCSSWHALKGVWLVLPSPSRVRPAAPHCAACSAAHLPQCLPPCMKIKHELTGRPSRSARLVQQLQGLTATLHAHCSRVSPTLGRRWLQLCAGAAHRILHSIDAGHANPGAPQSHLRAFGCFTLCEYK